LSWNALIGGAKVAIIADVGADAGGTARAETKATLSTWVAWNINAGSDDETVQNASELREVWSGEHGLDSWNGGGDESNLVDIISRDTDGEDDDTISLSVGDDGVECASVSVVLTISHHDHDIGNVGMSSVGDELLVAVKDTASNASKSSLLLSGTDHVDEGLLRDGESDNQSGSSGEHDQTHGNILRTKGVCSGNVVGEGLHLGEGS